MTATPSRQKPPPPAQSILDRWVGSFLAFVRVLLGLLFFLGLLLNFSNVVGRYVFFSPINWADEIIVYDFIALVFLGSILVTAEGRHLKMEIVSQLLPKPIQHLNNFVIALLFLATSALVAFVAIEVVSLLAELDQRSIVTRTPMALFHAVIPIAFGFMFLMVLWRFGNYVSGEWKNSDSSLDADDGERLGRAK